MHEIIKEAQVEETKQFTPGKEYLHKSLAATEVLSELKFSRIVYISAISFMVLMVISGGFLNKGVFIIGFGFLAFAIAFKQNKIKYLQETYKINAGIKFPSLNFKFSK